MREAMTTEKYKVKKNDCRFNIYELNNSKFYGIIFTPIDQVKQNRTQDNHKPLFKAQLGEIKIKEKETEAEVLTEILKKLKISKKDIEKID